MHSTWMDADATDAKRREQSEWRYQLTKITRIQEFDYEDVVKKRLRIYVEQLFHDNPDQVRLTIEIEDRTTTEIKKMFSRVVKKRKGMVIRREGADAL